MSDKLFTLFIKISAVVIIIYLLLPIFVLIISAFNGSRYFDFPPTSLTLNWFKAFINRPEYMTALGVSVKVALSAVVVSLISGVMAAFALDRYKFTGNAFMQGVFLSPLLLLSANLLRHGGIDSPRGCQAGVRGFVPGLLQLGPRRH